MSHTITTRSPISLSACIYLFLLILNEASCLSIQPDLKHNNNSNSNSNSNSDGHYRWTASIDDTTGLASSLETSSFALPFPPSPSLSLSQSFDTDDDGTRKRKSHFEDEKTKTTLTGQAQRIFGNYPKFLGSKRLSFGLLSARPCLVTQKKSLVTGSTTATVTSSATGIALCLPLPILNISLLTFGPPETQTQSCTSAPETGKEHIVTNIPIIGGLLSCASNHHYNNQDKNDSDDDENNDLVNRNKQVGLKEGNKSFSNNNGGSLQFEFELIHDCNNNSGEESMVGLMSQSEPEQESVISTSMIINTRIVKYQPAIAGRAPMNPFRKRAYLYIQRPIHAYVMWRFHQYCYGKIIGL